MDVDVVGHIEWIKIMRGLFEIYKQVEEFRKKNPGVVIDKGEESGRLGFVEDYGYKWIEPVEPKNLWIGMRLVGK